MHLRLIEKNIPIKEISEISIPERSSYKPIYQISKWFARRSSSTFRALLLAATLAPDQNLMEYFYKENYIPEKVVLDPFMGGGTTIVEGLRLGMKCIGIDINPVAWFITKTEVEAILEEDLQSLIAHCEANIKPDIQKWYKTQCPICEREAEIIYIHWVKQLPCYICSSMVTLFRTYILNQKGKFATVLCPSCHSVFSSLLESDRVSCSRCEYRFNPRIGNRVSRSSYKCSNCGTTSHILKSIRKYNKILPSQMYAIEGYCSHCAREKDVKSPLKKSNYKFIKQIDASDEELFYSAEKYWEKTKSTLLWPKNTIPEGTITKTLKNHHYRFWFDLFNSRQLICLSIIFNYIKSVEDVLKQELLLAAFINLLNHNNVFTRYSPGGHKVEGIFARHDFHPLSTFAENNVWGSKYGRGTWIKCMNRLVTGKRYNFQPYSHKRFNEDGSLRVEKVFSGSIDGHVSLNPLNNFSSSKDYNSILMCRDAEKINDIPQLVDLIITDPPYADNVNYSELSDFFYAWLRLILKDRYPFFSSKETPKESEAIKDKNRTIDYYKKLVGIFSAVKTKLKPDGLIIFTFHHSNRLVWLQLIKSLFEAKIYILKTYPIPSEARNVLNIQNKKAIAFDLIIVAKSRDKFISKKIDLIDFKTKFISEGKFRFKTLEKANITIKGYDHLVVIYGVLMELLSEYVVQDEVSTPLTIDEVWTHTSNLILTDLMQDKAESK